MVRYEVLKVAGQETSRTPNCDCCDRLQSVLKGRGMPGWHAGSSVHHRPRTWHSRRRESTQKHGGLGISLPTSAYLTYPALGDLLRLQFFCLHTGNSKTSYLQLFFLLNGMTAWLSLMLRWKKERTDTRDTAMRSRKCKWGSKHLVRIH